MAYELGNEAISVPASTDLSAKQFLFGTLDGAGLAVTGAGLAADGVIACGSDGAGRASALYTRPGMVVKGHVRRRPLPTARCSKRTPQARR